MSAMLQNAPLSYALEGEDKDHLTRFSGPKRSRSLYLKSQDCQSLDYYNRTVYEDNR